MKHIKKKCRCCNTTCRNPANRKETVLNEGDGEDVFNVMIDDMLELAAYVDLMYENTRLLSMGALSVASAMSRSVLALERCDEVLQRWEWYSQSEE